MKCTECSTPVCDHQWKNAASLLARAERAEVFAAAASESLNEMRGALADLERDASTAREHVRKLRGEILRLSMMPGPDTSPRGELLRDMVRQSIAELPDLGERP